MKDDKNLRQQLSAVELYVLGTPNSQTREDILKFLREQILQSKTTSTELEELVRHINGDSIVSRVLDNLQEATAITDTHGNILYSNQQFKQIIPKSSGLETFVGSNIFTDYHFESSSEKAKLLEEAIRTGGVRTSSRVKYVVQDKDGKEADVRYFNIRIAPFGDKSGAQIGAVDITREVLESVRDGLTGAYSQSFYVKELKNLAIA
ncbi:PAS domain-containing protein, partial [Candidatus Woesearchaeota archaeon]|nr:PAS domain-containing protein [Candidatus Woesearchaeota archaeon]